MKLSLQQRFLALFIPLFAIAVALVLLVTYYFTARVVVAASDDLLNSHLRELKRVLAEEGEAALFADMRDEVAELGNLSAFFLYISPTNEEVEAGSHEVWNEYVSARRHPDWHEITMESPLMLAMPYGPARVSRIDTANGGHIIGAVLAPGLNVLAQSYVKTGTVAVVLITLVATVGVFLLMRGLLAHVRKISEQARSIDECGATARLPLTGDQSEFDSLSIAINELLGKLQRSEAVFHQTADYLAHELRTPLTRLKSAAELSLRKGDENLAPLALEQVETLLELTNSMLELSTLEMNRTIPRPETVDLNALVTEALDYFREAYVGRTITLESTVPPEKALVRGNKSLLERVISNLLDNSLKYSLPEAPVLVTLSRAGESTRVSVRDLGFGIGEVERTRIFERFYRAGSVHRDGVPGFGLGLSFVKAAVEAHGGSVRADFPVDGGALFTVEIPAR